MKELISKGEYGYVNQKKKMQLILSIICFAIVFIIFLIGYLVCKTKNNIMTVIAILTVLPSARILVKWLVYARYKSPDKEQYDKLKKQVVNLPILSDCLISCKDKTIFVEFSVITDGIIYCYTSNNRFDVNYFEKNVSEFIKSCGDTVNVKLYTDYDAFVKKVHAADANEFKQGKVERLTNDFLILVI